MKNKKQLSFIAIAFVSITGGINSYAQSNADMFGLAPQGEETSNAQKNAGNVFVPLNYNSRAFGYNANAGVIPKGPFSFYLNTPPLFISLADQSAQNFIAGASWANNKWYGVVYSDNQLVTLDTITGARTVVGPMAPSGTETWTGMSYDKAAGIMYAVSVTGTGSQSTIYTVNLATGTATPVGVATGVAFICLAANNAGNLFAVDILGDNFGSVNKTTGAWTLIGAIGFNASFAQDMEFDMSTDTCFFASYNATTSAAELRTVNTITGATTLVGNFPASCETTGFAIPYLSTVGVALNETTSTHHSIYPNPVIENFTLEIREGNRNEEYTFVLYSILGKEVKRAVGIKQDIPAVIMRGKLNAGLYVYKLFSENGIVATGKLVMKNL